jgi:hypothetical protein
MKFYKQKNEKTNVEGNKLERKKSQIDGWRFDLAPRIDATLIRFV